MVILVELNTNGLLYLNIKPEIRHTSSIIDWMRASMPSESTSALERWVIISPLESQIDTPRLVGVDGIYFASSEEVFRNSVPRDVRVANPVSVPFGYLSSIASDSLNSTFAGISPDCISRRQLTALVTNCRDPELREAMSRQAIYRGVRFMPNGVTTYVVQTNVVEERVMEDVLKEKPRKLRNKMLKEVRRVQDQIGHFPGRMNAGSFAAALLASTCKETSRRNRDAVGWLREARENSRRFVGEDTRRPDESLHALMSRRYDRGTHPAQLPQKFAVPGDLVGVELEFVPPVDPNDSRGTVFKYPAFFGLDYTYDGSVKNYDNPEMETDNECRMLLRHGHYTRIKAVCSEMLNQGCAVNDSCGMHVHLDARDMRDSAAITAANRLSDSLPLLAGFTQYTRFVGARAERYCRAGISPSRGNGDHYDPDRYYAVNLCALRERGTIEVRIHHGTLDAFVIEGWIRLLRFLFRSSGPIPTSQAELLKMPGLADAMGPCMLYVTGPWEVFHRDTMRIIMAQPLNGFASHDTETVHPTTIPPTLDPWTRVREASGWSHSPGTATARYTYTMHPAPTPPTAPDPTTAEAGTEVHAALEQGQPVISISPSLINEADRIVMQQAFQRYWYPLQVEDDSDNQT